MLNGPRYPHVPHVTENVDFQYIKNVFMDICQLTKHIKIKTMPTLRGTG